MGWRKKGEERDKEIQIDGIFIGRRRAYGFFCWKKKECLNYDGLVWGWVLNIVGVGGRLG